MHKDEFTRGSITHHASWPNYSYGLVYTAAAAATIARREGSDTSAVAVAAAVAAVAAAVAAVAAAAAALHVVFNPHKNNTLFSNKTASPLPA